MSSMKSKQHFKIPSEWEYRGEGNCNIVLSLPRLKKVLRIRKTDKPNSIIGWLLCLLTELLSWYYGSESSNEQRDLQFYSKITRPLIGYHYVSEASQVLISWSQIKKLEQELLNFRPENRTSKILQFGRATLFDDFAYLSNDYLPYELSRDTYSVEIKPKQGWIPFNQKHIPKCVFCLNQYQKLKLKKIDSISDYCPKLLFSGDWYSTQKALSSLISNPQNNLKIFKNGKLSYGENNSKSKFENLIRNIYGNESIKINNLQEDFCELLHKSLTTNFGADVEEACDAKLFCKWDKIIHTFAGKPLPKGCVLEKILSMQMLDVEGSNYYGKLMTDDHREWDYVSQLLQEIPTFENTCIKCAIMISANIEDGKDRTDLIFAPYLIAAVANDCSLMVTFKKILDDEIDELGMKNIITTKYGSFVVNVGVFDLFPKPMCTIRKHEIRNKILLEAFNKPKQE